MEFDNNSPVSDEQRRLAEAKRITLQPIHSNITPEDTPDAETAAQHAGDPPIKNIETDIEQNRQPLLSTRSALRNLEAAGSSPRTGAAVITVVVAITIVGIAAASFFLTKK